MKAVVAFLDRYGLANTSGARHEKRRAALALARADAERAQRIEAAARAFMTDDYTWNRQEQGDPGPALRAALEYRP